MPQPADSEFVPTSYGQACGHCVRSKTSCRRKVNGGPCERCLRRGRECQAAPGGRREIGKRPGSRTTRLEEKLDNLVTLLQSSAGTSRTPPAHQSISADTSSTGDATEITDQVFSVTATSNSVPPHIFPPTPSTPTLLETAQPTPTCKPSPPEPEDVSDEEAQECLLRFQSEHLRYFPFIYIPPTVDAIDLQHSRPFLWMCILAVATKSSARQMALGAKIRQMVANKLIVEHERSLDTLLGLLAYMGWANYQLGSTQPFLSMYCHLITGLTQDLGLDRLPRKADEPQHPMACLKSHHLLALKLAAHCVRTMEERRAVIAAFIITSEVSAFRAFCFNRSVDGLRWNPSMDEYLQELEEKQEAPLDHVLVTLAKLKLIGEEAVRPNWLPSKPSEQLGLLQAFQVKALQSRLDLVKQTIPAGLRTDDVMQLHFYEIEMQVNETGLYNVSAKGRTAPDSQRLSMLARCVQATRSWFDCFFSMEPARYAAYSFSVWVQLSHAFTSIYRLSMLDEPGWDGSLVRESVDLLQIMEVLVERFSQVSDQASLLNDRADSTGIFANVIKSISTIRTAWEPMLRQQAPNVAEGAASQGFDGPPLDSFSAEFLDGVNGWMSDMMFSWDGIP